MRATTIRPIDAALSTVVCAFCLMLAAGAKAEIIPHAGIRITGNQRITKGTYRLAEGDNQDGIVRISGSGFSVDFAGAKLMGPGGKGVGIKIVDARNVTIRNADVSGYLWGFVLERCSGVRLIHCVSSRNADLRPGTVIDESGNGPEDNHGGGFVLRDSNHCLVQKCNAQHQWDGIDVVRSTDNMIEDGDYSYNGNWGIHLWTSSRNVFRRNRAIWCTTGEGLLYQSLGGWQTYDSQAVGIDHNSNDNTIEDNDLRFGGDAIFIRANEGGETPGSPVPVKNGSHRNRLLNNDCSFSPNNAIEVDFVDDTVIIGNNCSNSNYGMWLGYARRCIVKSNICVNDTSHAVEIENGQNDLFESNVFGWDMPRTNGQLVFLRQNSHDKTPSGPYTIKNNMFYGAGAGVQLVDTRATLADNFLFTSGSSAQHGQNLVTADAVSAAVENSTKIIVHSLMWDRVHTGYHPDEQVSAGTKYMVSLIDYRDGDPPPVVEFDGVPLWIRKVGKGKATVQLPSDYGVYAESKDVTFLVARGGSSFATDVTVLEARGGSSFSMVSLVWQAHQPVITNLRPKMARIGEPITVFGSNLEGGTFLLNGKPATVSSRKDNAITLQAPEGILVPTSFNLVWEKGEGADRVATWPVTVTVQVPKDQMPHLVSASFSPTTVKVGDLLKVTMTVRNNLPVPALLTTKPKQPFTYDEKQACYEMGIAEEPGHLHLRVSTDFFVGGHNPGSWPWMFGFDSPKLMPGESTTVVGYVRLQTPGTHVFRIGLVAGGFRFIDDNAYQTKITVEP